MASVGRGSHKARCLSAQAMDDPRPPDRRKEAGSHLEAVAPETTSQLGGVQRGPGGIKVAEVDIRRRGNNQPNVGSALHGKSGSEAVSSKPRASQPSLRPYYSDSQGGNRERTWKSRTVTPALPDPGSIPANTRPAWTNKPPVREKPDPKHGTTLQSNDKSDCVPRTRLTFKHNAGGCSPQTHEIATANKTTVSRSAARSQRHSPFPQRQTGLQTVSKGHLDTPETPETAISQLKQTMPASLSQDSHHQPLTTYEERPGFAKSHISKERTRPQHRLPRPAKSTGGVKDQKDTNIKYRKDHNVTARASPPATMLVPPKEKAEATPSGCAGHSGVGNDTTHTSATNLKENVAIANSSSSITCIPQCPEPRSPWEHPKENDSCGFLENESHLGRGTNCSHADPTTGLSQLACDSPCLHQYTVLSHDHDNVSPSSSLVEILENQQDFNARQPLYPGNEELLHAKSLFPARPQGSEKRCADISTRVSRRSPYALPEEENSTRVQETGRVAGGARSVQETGRVVGGARSVQETGRVVAGARSVQETGRVVAGARSVQETGRVVAGARSVQETGRVVTGARSVPPRSPRSADSSKLKGGMKRRPASVTLAGNNQTLKNTSTSTRDQDISPRSKHVLPEDLRSRRQTRHPSGLGPATRNKYIQDQRNSPAHLKRSTSPCVSDMNKNVYEEPLHRTRMRSCSPPTQRRTIRIPSVTSLSQKAGRGSRLRHYQQQSISPAAVGDHDCSEQTIPSQLRELESYLNHSSPGGKDQSLLRKRVAPGRRPVNRAPSPRTHPAAGNVSDFALHKSPHVDWKKEAVKMPLKKVRALGKDRRARSPGSPAAYRSASFSFADTSDADGPNSVCRGERGIVLSMRPRASALSCFTPKHSPTCIEEQIIAHFHNIKPGLQKEESAGNISYISGAVEKHFWSHGEGQGYPDKEMTIKRWLETTSFSKMSFQDSEGTTPGRVSPNMVSFQTERSSVSIETRLCRESGHPSPPDISFSVMEKSPLVPGLKRSSLWPARSSPSPGCCEDLSVSAARGSLPPPCWPLRAVPSTPSPRDRTPGLDESRFPPAIREGSPKKVAALTAAGHVPSSRRTWKSQSSRQRGAYPRGRKLWVNCLLCFCALVVTFELLAVFFLWYYNMLPLVRMAWREAGASDGDSETPHDQDAAAQ